MKPAGQQLKTYTKPLYEALVQMQRWLAREDALCVMVAAASRKALKRQHWPDHVEVTKTKSLGRKVAARGSRRILVAFWPEENYQAARQPSLICVLRGQATLSISDYKLDCRVGDFVLIPQGTAHSPLSHLAPERQHLQCDLLWIRPSEEGNRVDCWICHSQAELHESGPQYGACFVNSAMLSRQFLNLCEEAQNVNDGVLTRHLLAGVLFLLEREIRLGKAFLPRHHLPEDVHEGVAKKNGDPIEEACLYITEHLDKPLTAMQVAHQVCISRTLFHLKFQERQGQTFHQYLTAQRLAKASALLQESDVPVHIIAEMVGLGYGQLRRLYFQHYGCTPGEFRKRGTG